MITETFINGEENPKFNAETIGMLYTYFHEKAQDGITSPTIDEQKEIDELVSILPKDLVLSQISLQSYVSGEFAYTYVFKRPCLPNSNSGFLPNSNSRVLTRTISKIHFFLSKINAINKNGGYFYVTPIKGTNVVIGTFLIR